MARIVTQPLFVGLTTLELIDILSVEYLARLGINDKDLAWANSPLRSRSRARSGKFPPLMPA